MRAYPDSKCTWGYMMICMFCVKLEKYPKHVDIKNPIVNPPANNKKHKCEVCGKTFLLCNNYSELQLGVK